MKKFIYYLSIIAGIYIAVHDYFFVFDQISSLHLILYDFLSVFLLIFGLYGLKAEGLIKKFKAEGKMNTFCIEANYYVRKKGFFGKVFLFPFMKIKSKNSLVISFFGALAWVIIIMILMQAWAKIQGR